jgi:RNA recognition motif-containing protein
MKEGMKKLFVGNLSWKTDEESLKEHFSKVGKVVSVRIIVDPYTGKSKGFGFVEMETPQLAQQAITELNDQALLDRNLRVSLALERAERSGSGGPGAGGGGRGEGKPYRPRQSERTY